MANGFPEGNFRLINKDTGHCLASFYGGQSYGSQVAYDRLTGEKGYIAYSHTNDRVFGIRSEPQGEDIELWWFDSSKDNWGKPKNYLYNLIEDIRSRWVLQPDESQSYYPERVQPTVVDFLDPETDPMTIFQTQERIENRLGMFTGIREVPAEEQDSYLRQFDEQTIKDYQLFLKMYPENSVEENIYPLQDITTPAVGLKMFGSGRDGVKQWRYEDGFIYVSGDWYNVLTIAYKAGSNEAVAVLTKRGAPNQQWKFK